MVFPQLHLFGGVDGPQEKGFFRKFPRRRLEGGPLGRQLPPPPKALCQHPGAGQVQLFPLGYRFPDGRLQGPLGLLPLGQNRLHQPRQGLGGQGGGVGIGRQGLHPLPKEPLRQPVHLPPPLPQLLLQLPLGLLETGGESVVLGGAEDFAEEGAFLPAGGLQQLLKFPLGQHDDLPELLAADAQKGLEGIPHLGEGVDHPPVGEGENCLVGKGGGLAPLSKGLLGGAAADGVGLPLQEEAQLHKAFPAGGGAVAPEVLALAGGAAGLAVEGEGDGVKEGGFSRPGGAADEENPAFPGGGKIQGLFLPVGSKGA